MSAGAEPEGDVSRRRAEVPWGSTTRGDYGKSLSGGAEIAVFPGAPPAVSRILAFTGIIVSGLVTVLFIADLAAGFPFQRSSIPAGIGFILSGLLCGYLSWTIMPRPRSQQRGGRG